MDPHIWPCKSRTTSSNLQYSNYVRTQDVTLKTCRRRWMIGRSGERGSGISVLGARHDDDDIYLKRRMKQKVSLNRNFTGLIQDCPFTRPVVIPRLKKKILPYYLPIANGKRIGFIPFPWLLLQCKMLIISSRIWTRVILFISNDGKYCTTNTSLTITFLIWIFLSLSVYIHIFTEREREKERCVHLHTKAYSSMYNWWKPDRRESYR